MGFVIEGLIGICVVLLVLWLVSLHGSVARDRSEAIKRQQQEQSAQELMAQQARLYRKGEKLRCLGCEHTFIGPLTDTGCPFCHLSALVVTDRDYQQGRQAAQSVSRNEEEH